MMERAPTPPATSSTQAAAMFELIGGARALAVEQRGHAAPVSDQGSFRGARFTPQLWNLRRHHGGGRAVGIACSFAGDDAERLGTVVAAFDIDVRYPERLEVYADVARDLGIAQASVCTDGTRPTLSGKVAFYCSPPRPLAERLPVRDEIQARAQRDPRYGPIEKPKDVTLYPMGGEGGILRIGGRHATKGKGVDRITDLDGNDLDLRDVVPLAELPELPAEIAPPAIATRPEGEPPPSALAPLHRRIADALEHGLGDEYQDHKKLLKFRSYLGREARRLFGATPAGLDALLAWRAQIVERTPWCNERFTSPTTRRKGHPLSERSIEATWRHVCARSVPDLASYRGLSVDVIPIVLPVLVLEIVLLLERLHNVNAKESVEGKRRRVMGEKRRLALAQGLAVVLSAYYGYAIDTGLAPDCFQATYEQIAELTGLSKQLVHKYVAILVSLGLMVIHDRGLDKRHVLKDANLPDGKDRFGLHTVVGIVPAGKTPAHVLAGCKSRLVMVRQLEKVAKSFRLRPRVHAEAAALERATVRKEREPDRPRAPQRERSRSGSRLNVAPSPKRRLLSMAPEPPAKVALTAEQAALLDYARVKLGAPRRL